MFDQGVRVPFTFHPFAIYSRVALVRSR